MNLTTPRHIECSLEEYHQRAEWSNSQLGDLAESPLLFHGRHIAKTIEPAKKRCFDFGHTVHGLLSSPGSIDEVSIVIPVDEFRTKKGEKAANPLNTDDYREWAAEHEDKIQLKPEEMEAARAMVRSVYAHPEARKLLEKAIHYEHTLVWQDEATGLLCRTRGDIVCGSKGKIILVDAKSSRFQTAEQFTWAIRDYAYHRQAGYYRIPWRLLGYDVAAFVFLCLHNKPPYPCRVFVLDNSDIDQGETEARGLMVELAERLKNHGDRPLTDTTAWLSALDIQSAVVPMPPSRKA